MALLAAGLAVGAYGTFSGFAEFAPIDDTEEDAIRRTAPTPRFEIDPVTGAVKESADRPARQPSRTA